MHSSTTRVATAQIACEPGNVGRNLDTVTQVVREASAEGADLVVLPELALSGYSIDAHLATAAQRLDSPEIQHLRKLSRRTAIAVGIVEETPDHRFFNSALYFSGGELLHLHRKVYPPTYGIFSERKLFGVGTTFSAFNTPLGRVAMLICGDAWHPSLPYLAAHDGADLLLVMAASPRSGLGDRISSPAAWKQINSTYALTMSFFVCFSNRVGQEGDLHFTGNSHLVNPSGEVVAECPDDAPGFAIGEFNKADLRAQRLNLPFRRDDRLEFVLECGQRIRHAALERDRQPLAELSAPGLPSLNSPGLPANINSANINSSNNVAGRIHPGTPLGESNSVEEPSRWAM